MSRLFPEQLARRAGDHRVFQGNLCIFVGTPGSYARLDRVILAANACANLTDAELSTIIRTNGSIAEAKT
jgi:hypothetical protein